MKSPRAFQILLSAALAVCLASMPVAAKDIMITGQASVIDGDTIEIHGSRIRLNGIDAPESSQVCLDQAGELWRCGQSSAWFLDGLLDAKTVACLATRKDRYGRFIANCFVGPNGDNINAAMVEEGLAVAYRRYSTEYIKQERQAKSQSKGMWQGSFDMPWEWRSAR